MLAGWALCTHLLETAELDADLVVAGAEIRYRSPVTGTLYCSAAASTAQRQEFLDGAGSSGKGKITLDIAVGDPPSATLAARYCAIARS